MTKGNLVFMKNISGEITKEIFSVFLFLRNRSFGVPGACKYFFVCSRKFKDTSKTVLVKKNSKKHFSNFKMFKSEIDQICGFCLKTEENLNRIFLYKITSFAQNVCFRTKN